MTKVVSIIRDMKKKFEKARRRLITLLGGYTEPVIMPQPMVKRYERMPVRIRSSALERHDMPPVPTEILMRRMLAEVGDWILKNDLYDLNTEETPLGTEYRMLIEIIPPE